MKSKAWMRLCGPRNLCLVCLAGQFLLPLLPSFGADRFWTGGATPGPEGFYETPGNWALSQPPTLDDRANFDVASAYNVTLHSAPKVNSASVSAGHVTFLTDSPTPWQLSTLADWTQVNGKATFDHVNLSVGTDIALEGSSSLQFLPSSQLAVSGALQIGRTSPGTALVEVVGGPGSSAISVGGPTRVGNVVDGTGTLRLKGDVEGSFSSLLNVGGNGGGLMEVLEGAVVTLDGTLLVAAQSNRVAGGKLVIDGEETLFDIVGAGETAIGVTGRVAEVHVTNGGYLSTGTGNTHVAGGSMVAIDAGEVVVEGALLLQGGLEIANGGILSAVGLATVDGQVHVQSSGIVNTSHIELANVSGSAAHMTIEGAGSRSVTSGTLSFRHSGQLTVADGGSLFAPAIALGTDASSVVHAQIVGAGAKFTGQTIVLGGNLSGGQPVAGGRAIVTIGFGGIVEYTDSLHLLGDSSLGLDGGELRAPSFQTLKSDGFQFEAGTYTVMTNATIDAAVVASLPTGTLNFGRTIAVEGTATLGAPLVLNGGRLAVERLVGGSLLDFQSGTVAITGSEGLAIGLGGPLGSTRSLDGGSTLQVSHALTINSSGHLAVDKGKVQAGSLVVQGQIDLLDPTSEIHAGTIVNHGQISGEGRLMGGPLTNAESGEIAIAAQRQLRLGGTGHTNLGRIQLADGRLQVDGQLTNLAGGKIVGRGTLSVGAGFTNQGDLVLAGGPTDIFGDLSNEASGKVLVSGGAAVTFWDDVTHVGTAFDVSAGASLTFFGEAGFSVSGGGAVYFEQDITPGTSPGRADFGGDVHFGGSSHLVMELGGTAAGTTYDTLSVANTAHLGGELTVELIGGFVPQVGHQFLLLSAQQIEGKFSRVNLPQLSGHLALETLYDATSVRLSVVAATPGDLLTGDYNSDGVVDLADYTLWRNLVGTSGLLANDKLGGVIGAAHYQQWKNNFGAHLAASLTTARSSVPEPATFSLLSLLLAAILRASHRAAARPSRDRFPVV